MHDVFFVSDLHFGHRNICKYTDRQLVISQDDHDEWLIELWNKTVKKSSTVYHLGDLSFYKDGRKTVELLKKLNGRKILLKGNHDYSKNFQEYARVNGVEIHQYLEKKFVLPSGKNQDTCLFHFSLNSWHKQHHGSWNLFGHSHGGLKEVRGKAIDVGIDNAYKMYGEHKFFDLSMLEDYMDKREIYIADDHEDRTVNL